MNHAYSRSERIIARTLVFFLLCTTSWPAGAQQWEDPNQTTFGDDVQLENSADGSLTQFTIDSTRTTIGWNDLQQPENNTLIFEFTNPSDQAAVLNVIGAAHPSTFLGDTICSGGTCAFQNDYGFYIGDEAILDVGNLALLSGQIDQGSFLSSGELNAQLSGEIVVDGQILADGDVLLLGRDITNNGEIQVQNGALLMLAGQEISELEWDAIQNNALARAEFSADLGGGSIRNTGLIQAQNAALISQRIQNQGEILIEDGALLMAAADGIWVRRFDHPVTIRLPQPSASGEAGETRYAIENEGRIDAGLGHVRLSAADPLGFSIRQGTSGSIAAREVDIAGGETGRVHLSGSIDARESADDGLGGSIDISGEVIALRGARLDASGESGGGQIRIGGDQEGRGDFQRAQAVVVDRESSVRADALGDGDGGRVIVFSEDLISIDGQLSARGGAQGGNGGFIETSGHQNFAITTTPDATAPAGEAGEWLIDPLDIQIVADGAGTACPADVTRCLDSAVEDILDPDFDRALFDGVIQTVVDANDSRASEISASTLAKALGAGTNVTLSTLAFGSERGDAEGNIEVLAPITIDDTNAIAGTRATLTLLAANDIIVSNEIRAGDAASNAAANLALSIVLRANDAAQISIADAFSYDTLQGDVELNADISTGGGSFDVQGAGVRIAAGSTVRTSGGNLAIRTGTLDITGRPGFLGRAFGTPGINAAEGDSVGTGADAPFVSTLADPLALSVDGTIDTRRTGHRGGDVSLTAGAVAIATGGRRDVVSGQLNVRGSIDTGGGDLSLSGGQQDPGGTVFPGNVSVTGTLTTCTTTGCASTDATIGGDLTITAFRGDPRDNLNFFDSDAMPVDGTAATSAGQGGRIELNPGASGLRTGGGNLVIGGDQTRSVLMNGDFLTNQLAGTAHDGLIQITAGDTLGVDTGNGVFGDGVIEIGTTAATNIGSAGVDILGRQIVTSSETTPQSVTIAVAGEADSTLGEVQSGQIRIQGARSIDFGANTSLSAEDDIQIIAAPSPEELSDTERGEADAQTRLRFRGTPAGVASGVTLAAPNIEIRTGDGVTATSSGFVSPEDLIDDSVTPSVPSDLALQRGATAQYAGLRLAAPADSAEITIAQDGDFTIAAAPSALDGELDLDQALVGGAAATNSTFVLESSDGRLIVEEASGVNGSTNEVTLLGGLVLPDPSAGDAITENSVQFGDGVTALAGPAAFDVGKLTVSTPSDFTIHAQIADSIADAGQLVFEAGRDTGVSDADGRGRLVVDGSAGAVQLDDATSISLLAGASGFGHLEFDDASVTTIAANEIFLRAGAGSDSNNTNPATRSSIENLAGNVLLRDENGANFSTAGTRFSFQQDAAIDAETDLPTLAQFAAAGSDDLSGVAYAVRSDTGGIDLNDSNPGLNDAERFGVSDLELVSASGLDLSSEFAFLGDSILLGGTGNFTFTNALKAAFNPAPLSRITLRSGLGGSGGLSFDAGIEVAADRIDLIAGDGAEGGTGSSVNVGSANFNLSSAGGSGVFVLHQDDANFSASGLPSQDRFVGGAANLPEIFVLRSDSGELSLENVDFGALPIAAAGANRFVLEAETVRLEQTDASSPNLDLAGSGRRLRIRANDLFLTANGGPDDASGGRVLAGTSFAPTGGADSTYDGAALLVEAFDPASEFASTTNLSAVSLGAGSNPDPAAGQGLRSLTIEQAGSVGVNDLPNRNIFSGQLVRGLANAEIDGGEDVATIYTVNSEFGSVAIAPDQVNGSNLTITGVDPIADGIGNAFEIASGTYALDAFSATTSDSIEIQSGTVFDVETAFTLAAGQITAQPANTDPLPTLDFIGSGSSIAANQVTLIAGVDAELTAFEDIDDDNLPQIDPTGLASIERNGELIGSSLTLRQNANLDLTEGPQTLTAKIAAGDAFETARIESVQGDITADQLQTLNGGVRSVEFVTREGGKITVEFDSANPFAGYDERGEEVVLTSNEIELEADPGIVLNVGSDKLEFRSTRTEADAAAAGDARLGLLRSDDDALTRPIVRLIQQAAFSSDRDRLPNLSQFTVLQNVFTALGTIEEQPVARTDLSRVELEFERTGASTLTLSNAIRDAARGSNLILKSGGDIAIDLDGAAPGFDAIETAALALNSLDASANGGAGTIRFDIANFPTPEQLALFASAPDRIPPAIDITGDSTLDGTLALDSDLAIRGRDLRFAGDITAAAGAGLLVETSGQTVFEADLGTAGSRLDDLSILFEPNSPTTPTVTFGERDANGNPVDSDQNVFVRGDVVLAGKADNAAGFGPRQPGSPISTIGKALGDLTIESSEGDITMTPGERIAVGGTLRLEAIGSGAGTVTLSDAAALNLEVQANAIELQRRVDGIVVDGNGQTVSDPGPSIVSNNLLFENAANEALAPSVVGAGADPIFGVPNPFNTDAFPGFLNNFSVVQISPTGAPLEAASFSRGGFVPALVPSGASRSDLSGAFGPEDREVPIQERRLADPARVQNPNRLAALGVDVRDARSSTQTARLLGAAIIDDLGVEIDVDDGTAFVSESRLDAEDTEEAIALYEKTFGANDERAEAVRGVLQEALDRYLEETRARRVIGFELRRFVKNRPSTLLEAYQTLDDLDALFRFHRRLGLSPGEYRRIQATWLERIKPEGITVSELSEAIHPSRYVRGSDILDIFGR